MCRSIKRLREGDSIAASDEVKAAARQYVRKISGFTAPSARHAEVFEDAVDEIAAVSERLLASIAVTLSAGRTL